jgi:hypothetical protein
VKKRRNNKANSMSIKCKKNKTKREHTKYKGMKIRTKRVMKRTQINKASRRTSALQ